MKDDGTTRDENDDETTKSPRKRHGSRNQHKTKDFVSFLRSTFAFEHMMDVAGGKGELTARLAICHNTRITLVDPRVADIGTVYVKTVLPRLPRKWQERGLARLQQDPDFIEKLVQQRVTQLNMHFDERTVIQEPLQSILATTDLIVGLHADAATEAIVRIALELAKPFCVVPCCVFPKFFPMREVHGQPVRTYEQFCDYLELLDPRIQRTVLPFDGRNVAIWWNGKD